MTYEEWLKSRFCPDDCFGCHYNIPEKAKCTYPGKCYYYDQMKMERK